MSNTFFTSDLHIGHRMVSKLRTGMPVEEAHRREEHDNYVVAEHDDMLARNWDATVSVDDFVWVVGDISVGGTKATREALSWLSQRPGHKRLVTGNHDPVHPSNRDAHRWVREFNEVFEAVFPFARIKVNGQSVLMSHFPYDGDHTPGERYSQYRLRDEGLTLIHGHTHEEERFSYSEAGTPQIHVGVDAWNFTPVNVHVIAELMLKAAA